ncbi:hypothetical protein [Pseudomonas sp. PLMAX]|uniref:hypothetical protein n=1 Tax=Pseudomonas sp. PLMAX TaxID=2201998 RepID=UPI0038B8EE9C
MADSPITADVLRNLQRAAVDFGATSRQIISECRAQMSETSAEIQRLSDEKRSTVKTASVPTDADQ